MSSWLPFSSGRPIAHTAKPTATTRPAQPATTVPRGRSPDTFQTRASSTRPPSSGSPGTRLNSATNALASAPAYSTPPSTPPGTAWIASQQAAPTTRFAAGPTVAISALDPGDEAAAPNAVCPPHNVIANSRTSSPRARAMYPCASSCRNTETNSSTTKLNATR